MISVNDAILKSVERTKQGTIHQTTLKDVNRGFLTEDFISDIDLPSFNNSAMDGYALLYSDYQNGRREFDLIGEIQAGDTNIYELNSGQAYRIFTGAPTPLNCDLVIMQEHVNQTQNGILIDEENAKAGQNIRLIGEQVKKGDLALKKGAELTPAAVGYLASLGATSINTIIQPSITVVSTGNELVSIGSELKFGQIYESNSYGIVSELKKCGFNDVSSEKLNDNYEETFNKIRQLIEFSDYVILTGGISVGDYDFVGKALKELEVEEVFYKVKQKPGKPLFFGRKGYCHIYALPGNPAAALSCLNVYVKSSLRKFLGCIDPLPNFIPIKANNDFHKKGNRAQFLKAKVDNGAVTILEGQGSNMMHTFAIANALVYMNENNTSISKGDQVSCLLL
ncbi:MAG: molybdopterin molybdenumtransferase MoeA [Crocinitomicaceae bacterium]|nr:molybdopterin molybdenumtransferase MoeA [Crocinitomicaceae bacterium]|tara:strand:- start:7000 stop:8184 length:1185 start_codon:yes stop_codon:yes gene_type:complete